MREELSAPIRAALDAMKDLAGSNGKTAKGRNAKAQLTQLLQAVNRRSLFDIPHATPVQLDAVRDALMNARDDLKQEWGDYMKVALLHHHLVPFASQRPEHKPFEMMADASEVMALLGDFGVQVVSPVINTSRTAAGQVDEHRLAGAGRPDCGGYPAPGFAQGVRWIGLDRRQAARSKCGSWTSSVIFRETSRRSSRKRHRRRRADAVEQRPRQTRMSFPTAIEAAVERNCTARPATRPA